MKKFLLSLGLIVLFSQGYSQAVQRTMVILEIGTGTWCQYCPGAALGADDLIANGCQVAVIENHNGDAFANQYSNARNTYYGITGFPTAFFDGVLDYVGGDHTISNYPDYLPLYQQRYAVPSPLVIDISGTNSGNTYNITLSIKKVATINGSDLRVHLALTESNISYNWQGQTHLNFVNRLMMPDENGTTISFANSDMQIVTLTFTKDAAWVTNNLELVAFVQDNATKEIFNGNKVMLTNLQAPMAVDFSGTPTTGCAPLTVNFTDLSAGATNWRWEFPGATPTSSTQQNPSAVYNSAGGQTVTLTAWNSATNRGNKVVKTNYVNPSAVPVAPAQPIGNTSLCQNPSNELYTTTAISNATGYVWDLQPPTAGTLSPSGSSCIVDWDNTYIGSAQLKVKATNSCGDGAWSNPANITINTTPAQPGAPTGPTQLCQDPANSDYITSGSANASSYVWDISPASAGTITGTWTMGTVDWSATFSGTAEIRVKGVNGNCESPWSTICTVTVNAGPQPFDMSGGGAYCAIGGTGSPVGLEGSETGVNYTLYLNGTATSTVLPGTGSALSFGNQMTAGSYTVMAANTTTTCTSQMAGASVVNIDPQAPETPATPEGPDMVYTGSTPTTDYTTTGGTYATSYTWSLSPVEAGTVNGNTPTGTVTWDPTYIGPATIKVQGVNSCGGGTFSTEVPITVDNGVGIPQAGKSGLVSVYPNPVKDLLTISTTQTLTANITLYNTLGSRVLFMKDRALSQETKIDLSSLKPGVYYLNLQGDEISQTVKVIVE